MTLSKDDIELLKAFRDEICEVDELNLELAPLFYDLRCSWDEREHSQALYLSTRKANVSFLPDVEIFESKADSAEYQFKYLGGFKRPTITLYVPKLALESMQKVIASSRFEKHTLTMSFEQKRKTHFCLYFKGPVSFSSSYKDFENTGDDKLAGIEEQLKDIQSDLIAIRYPRNNLKI